MSLFAVVVHSGPHCVGSGFSGITQLPFPLRGCGRVSHPDIVLFGKSAPSERKVLRLRWSQKGRTATKAVSSSGRLANTVCSASVQLFSPSAKLNSSCSHNKRKFSRASFHVSGREIGSRSLINNSEHHSKDLSSLARLQCKQKLVIRTMIAYTILAGKIDR